jgi:TRAP-type mannitol/chloroaromatic compound transport system substrate-binding protein
MDRREFLKTTGGAVSVAASATAAVAAETEDRRPVAAPAIGSGTRELRLAMPWADNGRGFGDSARRLARRLEALSERRLRIVIGAGTQLAEADLVHASAHDLGSEQRAFAYFAGLPGETGLSPSDLEAWLAVGGGQALWDDLAAGHGSKPLLAGHTGPSPALWSARPIASLADLAGEKVFAMGLGSEVARALGAEPVVVPAGELPEALSQGTIRFVEWGGALQSLALGLPAAARYGSGNGFSANGTAVSLGVRLGLWESLSDANKALITAAAAEEFRASLAETRAHEALIRTAMTEAHGVSFEPFPADVTDAISRVADAMVAHVAGQDAISARIDRSYMAFKSAVGGAPPGARFIS